MSNSYRYSFNTVTRQYIGLFTTYRIKTISCHSSKDQQITSNSEYHLEQYTIKAYLNGLKNSAGSFSNAIYSTDGKYIISVESLNLLNIWGT